MPWKRKKKNNNTLRHLRYNKKRKSLSERESLSTAKETIKEDKSLENILDPCNSVDKSDLLDKSLEDKSLDKIPELCNSVDRSDLLDKSLEVLTRTRTLHNNHKACVCIICDSFIIGVEKICWLNEEEIATKSSYLSVDYFQSVTGKMIPPELRNQYMIDDNILLSNLLLSPRAHCNNGNYMSCNTCFSNVKRRCSTKPPKYAISNGWVIGMIPEEVIGGDIDDILSSVVARVRIFGNVYSYSAGAHKAIKGHHTFFVNDPEHVGKSFDFMMKSGLQPDIYVMICGRVTPRQRDIIRRRCTINADDYISLLNWMIKNHPSYIGMEPSHSCPQPIFIGGFNEDVNNTDTVDDSNYDIENNIEAEEIYFAARSDPTESTGPFQSEKDLIFSYLKGEKPTLLFKNGDYVGGHKVNLIDLFPIVFPYGFGGPDETRATLVSLSVVLRHYSQIALPQMQNAQFLLVLCSMWQRIESFKNVLLVVSPISSHQHLLILCQSLHRSRLKQQQDTY